MKYFLRTISAIALLSSQVLATNSWKEDVRDQVNLEVGQSKIIQKLMKSQDYAIDIDEGSLINTI